MSVHLQIMRGRRFARPPPDAALMARVERSRAWEQFGRVLLCLGEVLDV
jgi:hypothetical protein